MSWSRPQPCRSLAWPYRGLGQPYRGRVCTRHARAPLRLAARIAAPCCRCSGCIAIQPCTFPLLPCPNTPECISTHFSPVIKPLLSRYKSCIVTQPTRTPKCNTVNCIVIQSLPSNCLSHNCIAIQLLANPAYCNTIFPATTSHCIAIPLNPCNTISPPGCNTIQPLAIQFLPYCNTNFQPIALPTSLSHDTNYDITIQMGH